MKTRAMSGHRLLRDGTASHTGLFNDKVYVLIDTIASVRVLKEIY
jgi:hypothetical protein